MQEISNASAEQSAGVQEVGQAVTEMDHVTQQNASLVHESAQSADNLRHNAHRLLDTMSQFKLPNMGGNDAPSTTASLPAAPRSERAAPARQTQPSTTEWESF